MRIKRAMVLAAGFGKRLRPLTDHCPKPLIKVAGRSMLDRSLDALANNGMEEVVINGHYLSEQIAAHLNKRRAVGRDPFSIFYSHEEEILETGGGILRVLDRFKGEPFYVINGDIMWLDPAHGSTLHDLAIGYHALEQHARTDALLLLHEVDKAIGYDGKGDFEISLLPQETLSLGAILKPPHQPSYPYVFTGISVIHPRLFDQAPKDPFSLSLLFGKYKNDTDHYQYVYGLKHQGTWYHIGTPNELNAATDHIMLSST